MLRTIRPWKKATAVFIMLMITCVFEINIPVSASESEVVAAWNYNADPTSYLVPASSGVLKSDAYLKSFKFQTPPKYYSGGLLIDGWDEGAGIRYWLIKLSTKGYCNLKLSAKTSSSAYGPRDFKVIYSVDGMVWNEVLNSTYKITSNILDNYMPTLYLPEETSNLDDLYVKFIMISNIPSAPLKPYVSIQSSGTSQINNIIVSGEPIIPVTGVNLNITEKMINKGETFQLYSQVIPTHATNKNVLWETNNSSVAEVDGNGLVKAVGAGIATITATTFDGSFQAECTVTVKVPVTNIIIYESQTVFDINETMPLTASVIPENATNKGILWTSSEPEVAIVDENGKITAVNGGTAVITVKTVDGGFEDSCTIMVIAPVTGIEFNKRYLTVKPGEVQQLAATILPQNASNKEIEWESSDESIVTVDEDGNITGIKIGYVKVAATTKDGGFTAECIVAVAEEPVTGVRINKDEITIEAGKFEMLSAHLLQGNISVRDLVWSSDDESIAKVGQIKNNGKIVEIVGVAAGECIITVTTLDGGHTATSKVIVIPSKKGKK